VVWDGDSRKPKHFNNISKLEAHMRSIESV
jgi:hypothetical protein